MLVHGQSFWSFADSVPWQKKREEIMTALVQLGGSPVECDAPPEKPRLANALYWQYSDIYVKVRADKVDRPYMRLPWIASIEVFPHMPYECLSQPS